LTLIAGFPEVFIEVLLGDWIECTKTEYASLQRAKMYELDEQTKSSELHSL
jgi:hypothetical protein